MLSYKEKIELRQEYNRKIIGVISDYIEKYPDIRFGQLLYDIGVVNDAKNDDDKDIWGIEPVDMFNNLKKIGD